MGTNNSCGSTKSVYKWEGKCSLFVSVSGAFGKRSYYYGYQSGAMNVLIFQ